MKRQTTDGMVVKKDGSVKIVNVIGVNGTGPVDTDPVPCNSDSVENKIVQGRNWAYIAYPDSVPEDWLHQLESSSENMNKNGDKVTYFVSPLHDKDTFEDGTPKEPHYHVLMCRVSDITEPGARRFGQIMNFKGCEKIKSKKKYARYLCHLDEKDKPLYEVSDVKIFGFESYSEVVGSVEDKFKTYRDIFKFIQDKDFIFWSDFMDYCMNSNDDWYRFLLSSGTYQVEKYIKERRVKAQMCKSMTSYFNSEIAEFAHYQKILRSEGL